MAGCGGGSGAASEGPGGTDAADRGSEGAGAEGADGPGDAGGEEAPSQRLPPLEGEPFWEDIDLNDAEDLGHEARLLPEAERQDAGPVTFVDATDAAGLGAVVAGGNSHGVGIGFVDLNHDGVADLIVGNGRSNGTPESWNSSVHFGNGDGTFRDASSESGVGPILAGVDVYSIAAGDVDNDGDADLYIGAQETDFLLLNDGTGTFVDGTQAAGAGGPASDSSLVGDGKSKIAAFGDLDGDGDLDLVSASSTLPDPGAYVLRNRGDGTFEDITASSGIRIDGRGNPCAVLWSDYDNDGDQDLWIWNDRGGHTLHRNEGGATFADVTRQSSQVDISNPMGIDSADMDHDGDLDYYVSNIGNNPLLENQGQGTFVDVTQEAGTQGTIGWGLAFEDFNLDTWADLYVAQEDDLPYLSFTNLGTVPATFTESEWPHAPVLNGRQAHNVAVAFADYDNDGRVDVVSGTSDGTRVTLHRNETDVGTHAYLEVQIHRAPRTGQYGGVGARVGVWTGDLLQFRDIKGGSSRASQNELTVRFGLGHYTGADAVAVLWQDGRQMAKVNVEGNQRVVFDATAP